MGEARCAGSLAQRIASGSGIAGSARIAAIMKVTELAALPYCSAFLSRTRCGTRRPATPNRHCDGHSSQASKRLCTEPSPAMGSTALPTCKVGGSLKH